MRTTGTFEVNIVPQEDRPIPLLDRMTIDKTFVGGLEGISRGQMLSGGDPQTGSAGYVAMERFEGKLDGKSGSFILQHSATMHESVQNMSVTIVPGSGSDELRGIAGSLVITVEAGKHRYDLNYALT